jgi:murein DD-endopeptidase MepM/ murein hydrolase activator NlpD
MTHTIAVLLVLNTLLPLLGLWWLVAPHRGSRMEWLAKVALVSAYLFCVAFAGVWLVPSVYAPHAYALLWGLAVALSWLTARSRPWPVGSRGARARVGLYLAAALALAGVGAHALSGRAAPDAPAVALEFPLRDGRFYVANGGRNGVVNVHFALPDAFRGQQHALDIVAVDRLGQRAGGLLPDDPADYTIYGMPVYAPCTGRVARVVDGMPDRLPASFDRTEIAGNHLVLACGDAEVVLAHLREGSIEVGPGDPVRAGDRVAAVGNSGYSGEPHLHLHAQRPGAGGALDGTPLAMTFDGRTLGRGLVPLEGR